MRNHAPATHDHRDFNRAGIVKRRLQVAQRRASVQRQEQVLASMIKRDRRNVPEKVQGLAASAWTHAFVILLFFFVYLWLQVDPALQYQSTRSVFFLGKEFFKEFGARPGGIAEYVGAFLAQFGQVPWLGACLATIGAAVIAGITRELLGAFAHPSSSRREEAHRKSEVSDLRFEIPESQRRCLGSEEGGAAFDPSRAGQVPARPFHWVPVFLLLLLGNRYDYPLWPTLVGLLLSLGFALGYVRLPARSAWQRLTVVGLGAIGLGYLAGAGPCLLFAVLVALFEFAVRRRFGLAAVCLGAAGAVPFGAAFFLDADLARGFRQWGQGATLWLTVGLYLFIPLAILVKGVWNRIGGLFWVSLALMAAVAFLTFDANRKALLRMDHFAERGMWDEVLMIAPRIQGFTASSFIQINRALFHSGRMPDDMFSFPQFKGLDLLPGLNLGVSHCRALSGPLLELGQVNLAEHFAHEALEIEGERPYLLRQLARINVLKERPQAARVFLNLLRKVPFDRSEAASTLRDLENDPRSAARPEIAAIRPFMAATDFPDSHHPTEALLEQLLQSNRTNRMAFEYLMAHYLLTTQLEKFVQNLDRLNDFDYRKIPRHYQEAILLRQHSAGASQIDLRGRKIDPETRRRFEQFDTQVNRLKNRREEARTALAGEFADTYWFYYLFGQPLDRKPSTVQEAEQ